MVHLHYTNSPPLIPDGKTQWMGFRLWGFRLEDQSVHVLSWWFQFSYSIVLPVSQLVFKRRCTKFARNEAYCCLFPLMRISTIKMKEKLQNRKQIKGIIKTRYRDKRPNCPQNHIERACVMADKMKTLSRLCKIKSL